MSLFSIDIPLPYVHRQAVCNQNKQTWFLHMNELVEGRFCQIHATIIPQRVTLCGPKSKHLTTIYKLQLYLEIKVQHIQTITEVFKV